MGKSWKSAAIFAAMIPIAVAVAQTPAFEVASIKLNPGPWHVLGGFSSSGTRLTLEGYRIGNLITEAYALKSYQVIIPDSRLQSVAYQDVYNVLAKAPDGHDPTKSEFRQMIQTLLAERFQFKAHRETKEMGVYAMVVSKGGPKFKQSAPDAPFVNHVGVSGRNQILTLSQGKMDSLTDYVGGGLDKPVVDRTGLTGVYDIKFEATPEFRLRDPQPGDISAMDAIQSQLGLRLESQKAEVEVLVVDYIAKPSEN
jgi:uncharacterized protein (TIGR03435 family)